MKICKQFKIIHNCNLLGITLCIHIHMWKQYEITKISMEDFQINNKFKISFWVFRSHLNLAISCNLSLYSKLCRQRKGLFHEVMFTLPFSYYFIYLLHFLFWFWKRLCFFFLFGWQMERNFIIIAVCQKGSYAFNWTLVPWKHEGTLYIIFRFLGKN